MRHALAPLLLSLSSALVACSGAVESPGSGPSAPVAPGPDTPPATPAKPPLEIAWGSCSIPDGDRSIQAECATVDLPARRGVADSGTTPVAIYRLKSKRQPSTAQMWFLNGGPGGAGFTLAPYAQMVTSFQEGIDTYLIDHRGTGESSHLECPGALGTATTSAEYAEACSKEIRAAYGPRVDGFSTTESAYDVKELIEATAPAEHKVYVYGGSYGSYWAHRLLQIPDVRVDAVVTDGNCLGSTCSFDTPQSFMIDETMGFILSACKEDAACAAKLGPDPQAFAAATMQKLATGHCKATKLVRYSPAELMMSIGVFWPAGLPPILYRLDRCAAADVTVLDAVYTKLEEFGRSRMIVNLPNLGPTPKPTDDVSFSNTLQMHVIASEMISRPAPTEAQLRAKAKNLVFKPGEDSFDLSLFDAWVGYPKDELVGKWVKRDVPWLLMQGTFDFQTVFSLSTKALEQIQDPSIQRVRFDGGGHGVVFDSRCSLTILESFLRNPRAKVDASCTAKLKNEALAIDESYTQYFFGKAEAWD
ncbi:MAG: alpha/beta fold hydrolase [Deltaproteobacteria bacterium]|nr:alpha/beta fold hydrolase [Deltaproteobacteria bacterium]